MDEGLNGRLVAKVALDGQISLTVAKADFEQSEVGVMKESRKIPDKVLRGVAKSSYPAISQLEKELTYCSVDCHSQAQRMCRFQSRGASGTSYAASYSPWIDDSNHHWVLWV